MHRIWITAAAIALTAAIARTAAAQYVGQTYRHPPIRVTSTVNKLTELRDPSQQDRRMFLFEFVEPVGSAPLPAQRGGIKWKVWDGTNAVGSWSAWTTRIETDVFQEGPLGTSMAAVGGEYWNYSYGTFLPGFNAFFDYQSVAGTQRLARPWWNWLSSSYAFSTVDVPATGYGNMFQPFSGFEWKNGTTQRINLFGLTATLRPTGDVDTMYLRETWWDGSTWRFTDHGRPDDGFYLRMGPNSAVWTDPTSANSRGFVFVTQDDYSLYARYWGQGCGGWCWIDLGGPPGSAEIRTPLAVSYRYGSATRVAVFVAARMTNRQWKLWGRYSDNGNTFSSWQDYGSPPLEANRLLEDGFDMTAGVVYRQNGTLRINLFGTTDWMDMLSSGAPTHLGGHLIELYWDGATWQWGLDMPPQTFTQDCETNVPDRYRCPVRFQTMSASVVDHASWERIGVFGKDERDRTWELAWNGGSWSWAPH